MSQQILDADTGEPAGQHPAVVRGVPDGSTPPGTPTGRLPHAPVTFFSVVLGLAGTAIAWRRADEVLGFPALGAALAWAALTVYAAVTAAYTMKALRYPAAVRAEWRNPVVLAFTPAAAIGPLLLAVAFLGVADRLSAVLWWAGAVGQLALTLSIMSRWLTDPGIRAEHVHPGWFLPVVGNLVVPLAGVRWAPVEVSWFFFAVGLVYWLVLLTVVVNRLVTAGPLPARLVPTMAILAAPPAVAFLAYLRLGGRAEDPLARVLLGVAVFQALLLGVQARALRGIGFFLSWWALGFPMAAVSVALLVAARDTGASWLAWSGGVLLVVLTVGVGALVWRTGLAVARRQICRPE